MKLLAILSFVVILDGFDAPAQGTIQFKNSSSFPIFVALYPGSDEYLIGTDPTAESLGAGPGQVTVSLYVALHQVNQFNDVFFLAGTTLNSTATVPGAQGTFNGGNPYSIPTTVDADAFQQGTVIDYYFTAFTQPGEYGVSGGQSAIGIGYTLAGGTGTPGATFGNNSGQVQGFGIIFDGPEPSVITISGLGAAILLLFRRRK